VGVHPPLKKVGIRTPFPSLKLRTPMDVSRAGYNLETADVVAEDELATTKLTSLPLLLYPRTWLDGADESRNNLDQSQ